MDVEKLEQQGTIDYWLELTTYIREFVDRNYPLTQKDLKSIVDDNPTDIVLRRNEVCNILKSAMQVALEKEALITTKIMEKAQNGEYTSYSLSVAQQVIFEMKQFMLQQLWDAGIRPTNQRETARREVGTEKE